MRCEPLDCLSPANALRSHLEVKAGRDNKSTLQFHTSQLLLLHSTAAKPKHRSPLMSTPTILQRRRIIEEAGCILRWHLKKHPDQPQVKRFTAWQITELKYFNTLLISGVLFDSHNGTYYISNASNGQKTFTLHPDFLFQGSDESTFTV